MSRQSKRDEGFTLLEVLVSVTIVAIMATALWAVFRISVNSWIRGTSYMDVNQRHRSTVDLVRKQLACIYPVIAPVDLQAGGVIHPIFLGTPDSVQFVSLSSMRFVDSPGLTMVAYHLVRDDHGGYSLVEREEQYLGLDPARESIFDRGDETVIPVFQNLVRFSFEYLDPATVDRPAQWLNSWDSRETKRMPAALSLEMVSTDASGRELSRHMVVPVLSKPHDPRLGFVNPFETRPRRLNEDDPRAIQ